jgi:hypothetical protein
MIATKAAGGSFSLRARQRMGGDRGLAIWRLVATMHNSAATPQI